MRRRWYAACAALALSAGLLPAWGEAGPAAGGVPELAGSVFARARQRDPFNPPGWRLPEEAPRLLAPEETPAEGVEEPEIELRLAGIIRSGTARLAIVNGKILEKDERVVLRRGRRAVRVHVVDVGEEDVLVSVEGQQKRLRLEHGNLGGVQ